jgi:hypothetical protein
MDLYSAGVSITSEITWSFKIFGEVLCRLVGNGSRWLDRSFPFDCRVVDLSLIQSPFLLVKLINCQSMLGRTPDIPLITRISLIPSFRLSRACCYFPNGHWNSRIYRQSHGSESDIGTLLFMYRPSLPLIFPTLHLFKHEYLVVRETSLTQYNAPFPGKAPQPPHFFNTYSLPGFLHVKQNSQFLQPYIRSTSSRPGCFRSSSLAFGKVGM